MYVYIYIYILSQCWHPSPLLNRPISDSIIISPTTAPFIQGCVKLNLDPFRSSVYQPTNRKKKKHLYTADCNITVLYIMLFSSDESDYFSLRQVKISSHTCKVVPHS